MNVSSVILPALLIAGLGIISSCGYHQGLEDVSVSYRTVSIDPIDGDWNGDLTAALVERLAASGIALFRTCGGELILQVKLEDVDEKNIGFRYNQHKDGKIQKSIIPTETRLTAIAQVTLLEAATNTPVLGPVKLKTDVEFDHDYYNTRNGVNIFSLGQLNDYDEAYDAAYPPLIIALAEKIANYVVEAW